MSVIVRYSALTLTARQARALMAALDDRLRHCNATGNRQEAEALVQVIHELNLARLTA